MPKPKQTDAVIQTVLSRIEDGTLLPGAPILEAELSETCEVSRTPVREALIQLEAHGLVVRHARKGVRLFRPTTDEFLAILEVHARLEAQAAGLAAERISDTQAATLQACTQACIAFAATPGRKDHSQYYRLNMLFHAALAEASCNPHLLEMIKLNARKLMAQYRDRYRTIGEIERSAAEHEAITALVLSGHRDKAHDAMLAHFNYDRETVMHMVASAALPGA